MYAIICAYVYIYIWASLVAQMIQNLPAVEETCVSIPRSGSSPGGGNGQPLQYSCLENSMDKRSLEDSMGLQRVGHD